MQCCSLWMLAWMCVCFGCIFVSAFACLVFECAHMCFPLGMWVDLRWCACVCVECVCEMWVGYMHESRVPGYGHDARVRRGVLVAINTSTPMWLYLKTISAYFLGVVLVDYAYLCVRKSGFPAFVSPAFGI